MLSRVSKFDCWRVAHPLRAAKGGALSSFPDSRIQSTALPLTTLGSRFDQNAGDPAGHNESMQLWSPLNASSDRGTSLKPFV